MAYTEKYANFDLTTGSNDGSSEANAWQSWAAITFAAGQRVNVKRTASRYAIGAVSIGVSGTAGSPVALRGYMTAIGDGGVFQFDGNISSASSSLNVSFIDGTWSANTARVLDFSGSGFIYQCRADQQNAAGQSAIRITDGYQLLNCYAKVSGSTTGSSGAAITSLGRVQIAYCQIIGSGNAPAVYLPSTNEVNAFLFNTVNANGNYAVQFDTLSTGRGVSEIVGNQLYNSSHAIYLGDSPAVSTTGGISILHNAIYSCSGYGIYNADATNANNITMFGNAMGSLTSGRLFGMQNLEELSALTLTASPWVDAANGDFSINNTAGGGAVVRGHTLTV